MQPVSFYRDYVSRLEMFLAALYIQNQISVQNLKALLLDLVAVVGVPLTGDHDQVAETQALPNKEAILEVLAKAADDHKFLARLAENPAQVLQEYPLTLEERAALASGDLRKIESWVGKLDKRLSTWIWCRLQQEKW